MKGNWKEIVLIFYILASIFYLVVRAFDYLDHGIQHETSFNLEVALACGGFGLALFLAYVVLSGLIRMAEDAKEHRITEELRRQNEKL